MANFIISELAKKDITDMMKSGPIYVVSAVDVISYFIVFYLDEK